MKVKKNEILSVLSLIKPGLAKKDIIEQATHFIFSKGEIATFNDKICILHPFKNDEEFSVNGDELFKIIEGITDSELEMTLADDKIKIKSKDTKATLSTIVGEAASVTHLIQSVKEAMVGDTFWKSIPTDFVEGVYLCSFSASKDLTTGVKACCAIRKDTIYTTDNIRLSCFVMESEMTELLLPAKEVAELIKYPIVEYGVSENWAHFRTKEGLIFNCKIMKGDYPFDLIEGVFEDENPIITFPASLKDTIQAITPFAEGEDETSKSIKLHIQKGSITCKAQKEKSQIEKTVESEYTGDSFDLLINPVFFSQILNHANSFTLLEDKGMFVVGNFYHILALPVE